MIVCVCRVVSDRTIRQAIAEGAATIEDVARRCGAGTCCGACVPTVSSLLGGRDGASAPDCSPRAPALKSGATGETH